MVFYVVAFVDDDDEGLAVARLPSLEAAKSKLEPKAFTVIMCESEAASRVVMVNPVDLAIVPCGNWPCATAQNHARQHSMCLYRACAGRDGKTARLYGTYIYTGFFAKTIDLQ